MSSALLTLAVVIMGALTVICATLVGPSGSSRGYYAAAALQAITIGLAMLLGRGGS